MYVYASCLLYPLCPSAPKLHHIHLHFTASVDFYHQHTAVWEGCHVPQVSLHVSVYEYCALSYLITHIHTHTQHIVWEEQGGGCKKLQPRTADEGRKKQNKCANKQDSEGKKEWWPEIDRNRDRQWLHHTTYSMVQWSISAQGQAVH